MIDGDDDSVLKGGKGVWIPEFVTVCAMTHCMCHTKPWIRTLLSGQKVKGKSPICHEVAWQGYMEVVSVVISKREFAWRICSRWETFNRRHHT